MGSGMKYRNRPVWHGRWRGFVISAAYSAQWVLILGRLRSYCLYAQVHNHAKCYGEVPSCMAY